MESEKKNFEQNKGYNPIVTKEELIEILYQKNNDGIKMPLLINPKSFDCKILYDNKKIPYEMFSKNSRKITKEDISNVIDATIELENKTNKLYKIIDITKEIKLLNEIDNIELSIDFLNTYFFKITDNKYVYLSPNFSLKSPAAEKDFIKQIDYIRNNNLNEGKMNKDFDFLKLEHTKTINYCEECDKPLDIKFKEYDYIKVICENIKYSDIGIKDISKCKKFLDYHQEKNFLNIEEQIALKLIILFGITNIYLNNTDYYKEPHIEMINFIMEEINDYILFIKENMNKIQNEEKYTFNYSDKFNLYMYLHSKSPGSTIYKKIKNIDTYMNARNDFLELILLALDCEKLKEINKLDENEINRIAKNLLEKLDKKEINEIDVNELFNNAGNILTKYLIASDGINFQFDTTDEIINDVENEITNTNINSMIANDVNDFFKLLRYINFEYYVSKCKFEDAKKIFDMNYRLFDYFKISERTNTLMIYDMLVDTNIISFEEFALNEFSNDYIERLKMDSAIHKTVKVMLKFYINCYYYFKHFKDNENAKMVYDFLLCFKDGYGIEDFIFNCRYIKMAEELNGDKIDNVDNVEEVDIAINKLEKRIDDMKLINQFDIDDVENNYNNIIFSNFKKENREYVKKCIATGDKIMNTFGAMDIDFSNVVVEWSKAVETEIDEKLFSNEVISYNDKFIIEKKFKKIDLNGNEIHFRLKKSKDITVGIFNEMENYTDGSCNLFKYLYDNYFKRYYKLDETTYKTLCGYLKTISKPRNDSAHKGKTIDKNTAMVCKEKILASEKILEILSKLKKR